MVHFRLQSVRYINMRLLVSIDLDDSRLFVCVCLSICSSVFLSVRLFIPFIVIVVLLLLVSISALRSSRFQQNDDNNERDTESPVYTCII